MTFATKTLEIPRRVILPYVEHGDPAGVPMLMLHGMTDSWRSFAPVLPHLPEDFHALAMTQRGHGDASRPASGYRTRDFAADAAAFVQALDQGPAIIVGHSMGSTNALRFAIDYPELTRGLVILGSFARYQGNPAMMELWDSVLPLTDPIDPGFALAFQESTLAQAISPELLHTFVQESLQVPARVWRAALEGLMEDDFVSDLHRIKAPTLIVWGDRDALCPRHDQAFLLEAIAGSRLAVYQGAGHALHWEEPARFAANLVAFGRSLSSDTPARDASARFQPLSNH